MVLEAYRDVRIALAWGILWGLGFLVVTPLTQPEQFGFASEAYYLAAEAYLAGENPYLVAVPETGATFIYPPITLLAFLPHVVTGSTLGAYVLQLAINVLTAGAIAWLVLASLERHGVALARIDRSLVAGFVLCSVHSTTVYVMGQVNLQLALAIGVGAILVERGRGQRGGAAFAAAAAVKLFPAAVGAWLVRLREWRALAAAVLVGLALTLAGALLVGTEAFVTYLTSVLPAETKTAEFAGGLGPEVMYVTIRRPIAALLPGIDPSLYALLGLLVLAPLVLASYRDVENTVGRLTALLATVLGTLLALPFEAFYFSLLYVPLVPLFYLLSAGRVRRLLAAGTVLLSTTVGYEPLVATLEATPVPGGVESLLLGVARVVLGFAQPPLVGGLVILVACATWHHESVTGTTPSSREP